MDKAFIKQTLAIALGSALAVLFVPLVNKIKIG